jgi:hypothetical protein
MKQLYALAFLLFPAAAGQAQAPQTIEGFWQDIAGRTTFKRGASPSETYGAWYDRALDVTYPQAKQIRNSATGFGLTELNFDEKEYSVRVLHSSDSRIGFVRKANWSACRMEYDCRLDGKELFCSVQTLCQEAGKEVLDWRGDERYVRRASCARDGSVQAQGFPVKCL